MKEVDIYNKVVELIKGNSEKEDIQDLGDLKLEDVLDSLQFVKVVVSLEDEYDIDIPDKYLVPANLNSVSEMVKLVSELVGGVEC